MTDIVQRFDTLVDAMTARYGHLPIGLEMACVRLIEEQQAEIQRLLKENKRLRFECGALIKEQITRGACDVARDIAAREPIEQHAALDAAVAEERKP